VYSLKIFPDIIDSVFAERTSVFYFQNGTHILSFIKDAISWGRSAFGNKQIDFNRKALYKHIAGRRQNALAFQSALDNFNCHRTRILYTFTAEFLLCPADRFKYLVIFH